MTRAARARAALLAVLLVAFAVLIVLVVTDWDPLRRLDLRVAANLHDVALQHPGQVTFWKWVSWILHPDVERIAAVIAVIVLWLSGRRGPALLVAVVMVGEAVLDAVTKLAVGRERPVFADPVAHGASHSFPSGHAMGAVVAFGLLVLLVPRRFKVVAGVIGAIAALLVSYSRLALGVHYLSDVLGAWILGVAWLVLACWQVGATLRGPRRTATSG